jgi:hypothetical protein
MVALMDKSLVTGTDLTSVMKEIILNAARRLRGFQRRQFQAEMALRYCDGKARRAEQIFGWGRDAVHTGLNELRTGIRCLEDFDARGRHNSEEANPKLLEQIHAIVEPCTHADPQLRTPLGYTRITAKAVHEQLTAHAADIAGPIPAERTVSDILNRLKYRLRRVRKSVPQKSYLPPTPSSITCRAATRASKATRKRCGSP